MTPVDLSAHLLGLEQSLMQPAVRRSADRLRAVIAEDFLEHGATGATYDLAALIAHLAAEPDGPAAEISDFRMHRLSTDAALVTYRTRLGDLRRLRSSIWRREGDGWKMLFHQGTPAS